jgi:hypothetical protein
MTYFGMALGFGSMLGCGFRIEGKRGLRRGRGKYGDGDFAQRGKRWRRRCGRGSMGNGGRQDFWRQEWDFVQKGMRWLRRGRRETM